MKKIIKGGTLVNENRIFQADILIENDPDFLHIRPSF